MTKSESERWIKVAQSDLAAAQTLFDDGHYHLCAFHAQQSAEKALKGLLRSLNHIAWGHNCATLLNGVFENLPDASEVTDVSEAAQRLDAHYIPTRYPDAFPSGVPADYYEESTAQQAIEDARAILLFVQENRL